jgi:hypothetical protein
MFTLHEIRRRYLCRLAFVLGCVLPTCLLLGVVYWARSVALRHAVEREIATATGWIVSAKQVTWPKPGVVVVRGLIATDSESGQQVLSAKFVEIERQAEQLLIRADQPLLKAGQSNSVNSSISQILTQRLSGWSRVIVEPCDLTVELSGGTRRLFDLTVTFNNNSQDTNAVIGCRVNDLPDTKQATLRVLRDRHVSPAEMEYRLITGETPVPCDLLCELTPALSTLGERATFLGKATLRTAQDGLKGNISGDVASAELRDVFATYLGQTARATASLQIHQATVSQGRLTRAKGSLHAGPGEIAGTFVESVARDLNCPLAAAEMLVRIVHFDELAFDFELDAQREFLLRGGCAKVREAILVDDHGRSVLGSPLGGQPVWTLAKLFSPLEASRGPLSRQSSELLSWLPLPDARAGALPSRTELQARRPEIGRPTRK